MDPVSIAAIVSAAGTAVAAGSSLAGTTVGALTAGTGYSVSVGIQMENWTKFLLASPACTNIGGLVQNPPSPVLPAKKEALVVHKTGGTATGTYGTVSWLIAEKNCRVVAMWSAPFNHDYYTNWLAVGFTDEGVTDDPGDDVWFNQMYYECSGNGLNFAREQYYTSSNQVSYSLHGLVITGNMGSSHTPSVELVCRPAWDNTDDLAQEIKDALNE